MNVLMRLVIAAGLVALSSTAGFAQKQNCRAEIVATGKGALTDNGAKEKAIGAWRNQAISSHGIFYGEFAQANDGKGGVVERCARTLLGLKVCQARGTPCTAPAASNEGEIACDKGDSKNCDPIVKWIQTRLNAKGGAGLTVDGSDGPSTQKAIRKFKKSNGLSDDSDVDEKLINALKA